MFKKERPVRGLRENHQRLWRIKSSVAGKLRDERISKRSDG